ncbi:MAG: phosphoribosylglycinamide formyltransferase [Gemmataceae bacterium]|nr:phosphoribosylglycinamide formyltransferase [Gemmata sp.]MDW8197934.1 phosphoribosylglycinamide formyltransferase [Gemmataceae bacterium]
MPTPLRLVVLISGHGTTLQNLIDRIGQGALPAQIVGVISSRAEAFGITRAQNAAIPVAVIERPAVARRAAATPAVAEWSDQVWNAIRHFDPQLVCMAGWLHLLPIPDDFRYRVLNIHPALLPAFGGPGMYGRRVHEAVLKSGVKISGCTVHFADNTYDTGPIIVQKCVPVADDDTPETLAARVFAAECDAYPEAIQLVGYGRVVIQGRRVVTVA